MPNPYAHGFIPLKGGEYGDPAVERFYRRYGERPSAAGRRAARQLERPTIAQAVKSSGPSADASRRRTEQSIASTALAASSTSWGQRDRPTADNPYGPPARTTSDAAFAAKLLAYENR